MEFIDYNSGLTQAGTLRSLRIKDLTIGPTATTALNSFSYGAGYFEVRGWGAGSTEYITQYSYQIVNNLVYLTLHGISQNMLNTGGTGFLYYSGFYNTIIPALRPVKDQYIPIRVLKAGVAQMGMMYIQGSESGTTTPIRIYYDLNSAGFARDGASAGWDTLTVVYSIYGSVA